MILLVLGLLIGLALYWIWDNKLFPKIFPYIVVIMEKRQNGLFPMIKYARQITKNGRRKLHFFMGGLMGDIAYDNIQITAGGVRNGLIMLFSPNKSEYHPVKLDVDSGDLELISTDQRHVNMMEMEDEVKRYTEPNKLAKYMPVILLGTVIAVTLIIGVYGWQSIVDMSNSNQARAEANEQWNDKLFNYLTNQETPPNSERPPTPTPP